MQFTSSSYICQCQDGLSFDTQLIKMVCLLVCLSIITFGQPNLKITIEEGKNSFTINQNLAEEQCLFFSAWHGKQPVTFQIRKLSRTCQTFHGLIFRNLPRVKIAKISPGEVLGVRVNHGKTKDHENYNFRQEKIQNYNIQLKITMEKISRRGASWRKFSKRILLKIYDFTGKKMKKLIRKLLSIVY